MQTHRLALPQPFHLEDVVNSHGWHQMEPFEWEPAVGRLARWERGLERPFRLEVTQRGGELLVRTDAPNALREEALRRVRWMLSLDDDLGGFHALCRTDPGLRAAAERGRGRMLRSTSVWEDLVRTYFCLNTTWAQSKAMNRRLVELCAEPDEERRAFPGPDAVASVPEEELKAKVRCGYRAGFLSRAARMVAEGAVDLEGLRDPSLPDEEVEARLRELPGVGPYAAGNLLLLLGRYDLLPVDSWFRTTVRRAWFDGRETTDRELVAAFERYRPYRTLAYFFYDWEGANRPEEWQSRGER